VLKIVELEFEGVSQSNYYHLFSKAESGQRGEDK
jgi:hypothetical protein